MNHPGTADLVIVLIVTRIVGKAKGASVATQVTSTHCGDKLPVLNRGAPPPLFTFSSRPHTLALGLAERAGPLVSAAARESVDSISAVSSILTGIAQALVDILVAVESLPSGVAVASVTRSPGGGLSSP